MKAIYLLAVLLMVSPAFAQTGSIAGSAFGWKIGGMCLDPDTTLASLCILDDGSLVTSTKGAPYDIPPNIKALLGTGGFAGITLRPIITLPSGTQATVQNLGTAAKPDLQFSFPAPRDGINGTNGTNGTNAPVWATLDCDSATGVMTLGAGGVVTISKLHGVNCKQSP